MVFDRVGADDQSIVVQGAFESSHNIPITLASVTLFDDLTKRWELFAFSLHTWYTLIQMMY
jgi:hypothetical protein